jgi:hypothetical protein
LLGESLETPILSLDLLETGIAALQQQQYQEAIGSLEAFCHDCATQSQLGRDYLRAQMHLISTYEQQGQRDRALTLCQNLTQSANAQVQIWAEQKLKSLHLTLSPDTEEMAASKQPFWSKLSQIFATKAVN